MFFCCGKQDCPKNLSDRLIAVLTGRAEADINQLLDQVSEYKVDQKTGALILLRAFQYNDRNVEIVRKIFESGITSASVYDSEYGKGQLLREAVINRNHNMVRFLLESGLDPNQRIEYKLPGCDNTATALHVAIHYAAMSLDGNDPAHPLYLSCAEVLIKHGADINARSLEGTPLDVLKASLYSHTTKKSISEFCEKHGAGSSNSLNLR